MNFLRGSGQFESILFMISPIKMFAKVRASLVPMQVAISWTQNSLLNLKILISITNFSNFTKYTVGIDFPGSWSSISLKASSPSERIMGVPKLLISMENGFAPSGRFSCSFNSSNFLRRSGVSSNLCRWISQGAKRFFQN